ncbi:MAG TPA: pseudouridine synthase, partial [Pirellulales bacterium]
MPIPAPLVVLYEDNHLLVVDKPAGLPTMGVTPDRPSLLAVARQYIKDRYQKPGNVYLGTVSRLDTPVSGIVVFARTSKAASRLSEQYRNREVEKRYWALVAGNAPDE